MLTGPALVVLASEAKQSRAGWTLRSRLPRDRAARNDREAGQSDDPVKNAAWPQSVVVASGAKTLCPDLRRWLTLGAMRGRLYKKPPDRSHHPVGSLRSGERTFQTSLRGGFATFHFFL